MLLDRRELLSGAAALLWGWGAGASDSLPEEPGSGTTYAVRKQTLRYASPGGNDLLLDLYLPEGAPGPLPVIVFLHGGGWSQGSRTTAPDLSRYFAREGFAMASIDYRLTPAIQFPANLEDVKTAVRWLRAHAGEYRLDTARIGLWGTSAGAYLGAIAGLTRTDQFAGQDNLQQSSAVRCVLDAYGPVSFGVMDRQTAQERATLQPLNPKLAKWMASRGMHPFPAAHHDAAGSPESRMLGAALPTIPEQVRRASPLTYVNERAPPFLIMHGLADNSVPHHQSIMLYEALATAGRDVTLRLIDGLPHGFVNFPGIDQVAGPFRMHVRSHRGGDSPEQQATGYAAIFAVSRQFFRTHLLA